MGLVLFPDDGDLTSPDISWSYSGFHMFRQWLADAEGLVLSEMTGFGGDRPWSRAVTTLTPLLSHPDDGLLTPAQCAVMLPRLREIADQRRHDEDPVHRRRVEDTRQLVTVMTVCVDKDVPLTFG